MSIATLIIGESGTGKTASLRTLPADKTALIKVIDKPLPFRSTELKSRVTDKYDQVTLLLDKVNEIDKNIIVIDDFQYMLANEFMRRSDEVGFTKFTEIAKHAWELITYASSLSKDKRVYFLMHSETTDQGRTKAKTIGKLLDEKITLEGLFTIVLRTAVVDGQYKFLTQNSGMDTVKSPMELFPTDEIENDLNYVDDQIVEYYNLTK